MDYYDILEIPRGASPKAIKASYQRLMKLHHPNRYIGLRNKYQAMSDEDLIKLIDEKIRQSEGLCKLLNEAYEVLSDHKKRQLYDAQNPEYVVPKITVKPSKIDFGKLTQGEREAATFVIENSGGDASSISVDWEDNPDWGEFVVEPDEENIFPIEVSVSVSTDGISAGAKQARIVVRVDSQQYVVDVALTVTKPSIATAPKPATSAPKAPTHTPATAVAASHTTSAGGTHAFMMTLVKTVATFVALGFSFYFVASGGLFPLNNMLLYVVLFTWVLWYIVVSEKFKLFIWAIIIVIPIAGFAVIPNVNRQMRLNNLCDDTRVTVDWYDRTIRIEDKGSWFGSSMVALFSINNEEFEVSFRGSTTFVYLEEWRKLDRNTRSNVAGPEMREVILVWSGDPTIYPSNATSDIVAGRFMSQSCNRRIYATEGSSVVPTPTVARSRLVTAQIADRNISPCTVNRGMCRAETSLFVINDTYAPIDYSITRDPVTPRLSTGKCNENVYLEGTLEPGQGTMITCQTINQVLLGQDEIVHPCIEFSSPVVFEGNPNAGTEICLGYESSSNTIATPTSEPVAPTIEYAAVQSTLPSQIFARQVYRDDNRCTVNRSQYRCVGETVWDIRNDGANDVWFAMSPRRESECNRSANLYGQIPSGDTVRIACITTLYVGDIFPPCLVFSPNPVSSEGLFSASSELCLEIEW